MGFFILTMNYKQIYDNICKRGQERERVSGEYYEVHHILPRCMGGTDDVTNLTTLTGREHFIAHLILMRLHPDIPEIIYSAWLMANKGGIKKRRKYKVSARVYASLKVEWSIRMKKLRTGTHHSEEVRRKISENRRGKGYITKGSTGMKWYHSLTTDESIMCFANDKPDGWVMGRNKSNATSNIRKTKWIHNPNTLEYLKVDPVDGIPDGWCVGSGKGKVKSIHKPTTMERKYIPKESPIPDGWLIGIGSLSEEHKNNIRGAKQKV